MKRHTTNRTDRRFTRLQIEQLEERAVPATNPTFTMAQTLSDQAQVTTLAFDGLAMMTGNLDAQSFYPPGKVSDYFGFQYMRDNDLDNMGHNTSFLTRVANNVIYTLNTSQLAQMGALAVAQADQVNLYAYERYPLMQAFRDLMTGAIPSGSTGLNLNAVENASKQLYLLDGQISFDRALMYANIINSLDSTQTAYLSAMKAEGFNSWPDISDSQIQSKIQALPQGSMQLVMTYASDIYAWYAGSTDADVYFCPERYGTYFGGFYIKDAPAVGHEGYSISEQLTATAGAALCDSSKGYVTADQAATMSSLVDLQRNDLYAGTTNIVQIRTDISGLLRSLLTSTACSDSVKTQVLALSATEGVLDGEDNYNNAEIFAKVYNTLTATQKTNLSALRTSLMSGTYSDGTAFDYSVCTTPFCYSDAITDASVIASYIAQADNLFFDSASQIEVICGTTLITDGTGSMAFGSTPVGTSISKTFTITNLGTTSLTLTAPITVPSGFTVTSSFGSTTVAAGDSTTFTVRLNAVTAGTYSGTLSFADSVSSANPFNFTISGTVTDTTTAQIQILDGTTAIANGTGSVAFGSTTAGTPITKTFTIKNLGTTSLTLTPPIVLPSGFTVSSGFGSMTVAAGASTTFGVQLSATTAGTYSGTLSITDSVSGASPYSFTISGTVTGTTTAQIQVLDGTVGIVNSLGSASFGTTSPGTAVSKTFTVKNVGTTSLTLTAPITVPSGFTVTSSFGSTTLAAGASTSFTVRMNATTAGSYSGTLSFADSVSGATPFSFTIYGAAATAATNSGQSFTLTSSACISGGTLPINYTTDGSGSTPQLAWANVPAGTQSFALMMTTQPDSTTTKWNWVLYDIPATTTSLATNTSGIGTVGMNSDTSTNAYAPPQSKGPSVKTYTFTAYALSAAPSLPSADQVTGDVLTQAISSLTLGSASMTVAYSRTAPTAGFSYTQCAGTNVNFTSSTGQSASSGLWSFGDGATSTAQNPSHTYSSAGSYKATLTVADDFGSNTTSQTVTVAPAVPKIQVLQGTTVIANSTGSFAFGSTPLGTAVSQTFTITNTGIANLTLTAPSSVPTGFAITTPFGSATVAPGASTTFVVSLTALTAGTFSGRLYFATNVSGSNPFNFTLTGTVTAPKIQVLNGTAVVANGTGSVPFGSVVIGGSASKTLTIKNVGTSNLTLTAPDTVPTGFTITSSFGSTTLAPGASTTLVIGLNTSSAGTFTGKLSFADSDTTASHFSLTLSGTVTAPKLQVLYGSTVLSNGVGSISFGSVLQSTYLTRTITVKNAGTANLTLTAPSTVPTGFTIASFFGQTTLLPGGSTSLVVRINTTTAGSYSGTLSFADNDSTASPFSLTLSGTVTAPQIQVQAGMTAISNGTGSVAFGSTLRGTPISQTFTIKNPGTSSLVLSSLISVPVGYSVASSFGSTTVAAGASTTFVVKLNATAAGTYSGKVVFSNNVSGSNPFSFAVSGTVTAPKIQVLSGTTAITNNMVSVAFGSTLLGTPLSRTFTIKNLGTSDLSLTAPSSVPTGFAITSPFGSTTLAPGDSTTLVVSLSAATTGTFSGKLSFATGDSTANPFNVNLYGTVTAPKIQVLYGSTIIANNTGSLAFGSAGVGTQVCRVLTIRNLGTSSLILTAPSSVPTGFTIASSFSQMTLPPGGLTTLVVKLNTTTAGTYSGTMSFATNDTTNNPFSFTLSGTVTAPQIQVLSGTTPIASGTGAVDFGTTTIGIPVTQTFIVQNLGTSNLILNLLITVPTGFMIVSSFGSTILTPGASTTFVIRLKATTAGTFSGKLSFADNDTTSNPFSFTISGVVNTL